MPLELFCDSTTGDTIPGISAATWEYTKFRRGSIQTNASHVAHRFTRRKDTTGFITSNGCMRVAEMKLSRYVHGGVAFDVAILDDEG